MRHASGGAALHTRGPHPGHGHPRHARGGKADDEEGESESENEGKAQIYNAQGSAAMHSAMDEKPGFEKGGHVRKKRRSGGHAEGHMAAHRMDRRPRRAAGGRAESHSPYSSAGKMSAPENTVAGSGFEGTSKDLRGTK
jgi:hypothetical protein